MRALRERPTTLERWPKGVHPGIVAVHAREGRGRRVLPEAHPARRAGLRRDGDHPVPVRALRRRDLPDRDRRRGVGGADGNDHVPSVAGAPGRRRSSRRAAARPRSPAGHGLRRTPCGLRRRPASCWTTSATPGFPKTSGGRGVHIYVRIEPRWTFTDVRHAAIAFGRELERRRPGEVTTKWWKEERGESIFVDYNQNARDRTIASAYSIRPKPGAPVSAPVTWDELGRRRSRRTSRSRRCPPASTGSAICTRRSTTSRIRSIRCSSCTRRQGRRRHAVPARLPEDAGRAQARATEPGPRSQEVTSGRCAATPRRRGRAARGGGDGAAASRAPRLATAFGTKSLTGNSASAALRTSRGMPARTRPIVKSFQSARRNGSTSLAASPRYGRTRWWNAIVSATSRSHASRPVSRR